MRAINFEMPVIAEATLKLWRKIPPGLITGERDPKSPRDRYEVACLVIWHDLMDRAKTEMDAQISKIKIGLHLEEIAAFQRGFDNGMRDVEPT